MLKIIGKKKIYNFTLIFFVFLNLWCLLINLYSKFSSLCLIQSKAKFGKHKTFIGFINVYQGFKKAGWLSCFCQLYNILMASVFRVGDKLRLKPACSAPKTS